MAQLFTNFAAATLASGIGASDTSISLAAGKGALFPSPSGGDYTLAVITQAGSSETSWEVVKITGRSADTLTVVRAQEGTTAAAWSAGDKLELRLTAGTIGSPDIGAATEVTVASAATTAIGAAASRCVLITGTAGITSFGSTASGITRYIRFAGALTLTHNATSLILPNGGNNITTAAGDSMIAESLGGGNWKVVSYQRADGTALVATATARPVSVISSNTTAVAGTDYVLTASLTLTLPATPSPGDRIGVVNRSGTTTCVIGRNGNNIMGLAEDMTIESATASFTLLYADATRGWVLI